MKDKETPITVTEAARHFADYVNRVHYQNMSYVLLKNGRPFARLVPESEMHCSGQHLAEALAETPLSPDEARAWHRDLKAARKNLKKPLDKWQ